MITPVFSSTDIGPAIHKSALVMLRGLRGLSTSRVMKSLGITALLLILAAGVAFSLCYIGPEEQPPCASCNQTRNGGPPTPICELMRNTNISADRPLLVEGRFRNDAGQLFIEGGGCTMHAGFSKGRQACSGAWKKLQVTCGVNTWYDCSAFVRLSGLLSNIPEGNYYVGEKGFVISCLEEVRSQPTFSQRIKFGLGRLF